MSCPEWEERIAAGDPEADGHMRRCAACAALAAGLARDARALAAEPPGVVDIDYHALRHAARRQAIRIRRRRKAVALLAAAAVLLIASRLALHHPALRPLAVVPAPVPGGLQSAAAPVAPAPVRSPRRHPQPAPDLDRQFAAFLRARYAAAHPASEGPTVTPITTRNPKVIILLLEESKGNPDE